MNQNWRCSISKHVCVAPNCLDLDIYKLLYYLVAIHALLDCLFKKESLAIYSNSSYKPNDSTYYTKNYPFNDTALG